MGIVADSSGYWVTFENFSTFRGGVYRLNSSFSRTRTINFGTSGPTRPDILAEDPSGRFWVHDLSDGRIHRYNSSWSRISAFTPPSFSYEGSSIDLQGNIAGMDFDADGNLWFVTTFSALLVKYDVSAGRIDEDATISLFEIIDSEPFLTGGGYLAIDDIGDFWINDRSNIHRISGSNQSRIEHISAESLFGRNAEAFDMSSVDGGLVFTGTDHSSGSPRDVILQVNVPKPSIPPLQLAPRYLKIVVVQVGGGSILGSTDDDQKLPRGVISVLEVLFRQGLIREVEIFTGHLLTFNNFDVEDREGYSNSLLSAPVVTETLPSLTAGMTSFGGLSITIADPSMRRFFDGSETETTTQNPVRVYRTVCGKRSLVWNGFLDGVGVSATHQTTLNCRPIMKKFEQLADFGFAAKSPQWKNHNFLMPIVACKLIPWSVRTQAHSSVGTETYSLLGAGGITGGSFTTTLSEPVRSNRNAGSLTTYRYRDYARSLGTLMQAPYEGIQNFSGGASFDNNEPIKAKKELNNLAKEHLDRTKKPIYVSFSKSELPASVITVDRLGAISFQRGVFFAPTENTDDAYSRFYIDESNYVPAPIPRGALACGQNSSFTSQPFSERFLIGGSGDFSPFRTGDWRGIDLHDLKQGLRVRYVSSRGSLIGGREVQSNSVGYDDFSLFPSLSLGDSYCNWTHIPVPFSDAPLIGALRFPTTNGGFFERPVVRYSEIPNYRSYTFGPGYSDLPDSTVPHPLDSFFLATYTSVPSFTPSEDYYFKAVMYTPHQVGLTYFGRKYRGTGDELSLSKLEPEQYFYTQWCTFTAVNENVFSHEKEIQNHHSKVASYGSGSANRNRRVLWFRAVDGTDDRPRFNTWLARASQSPYPMARCKDMYTTESSFENDQSIRNERLQMIIPLGRAENNSLSYKSTDTQVDPAWKSGAASNMRVMPAYPRRIPVTGRTQTSYPILNLEGEGTGAYYVTAEYLALRTCGYWDTNIGLNPTANINSIDNFRGHYHHHRQDGKGVSPYNFLYSIVKSVGFEPDWAINDTQYDEMTAENPMQVLSNTGQTYKSLIDRTCPGLGKILRWDPTTNRVEIINWLSAHRDSTRDVQVLYDENCLRFEGLVSNSASIPSSFTFENPDILKGENTLEGFSEENKLLGRYVRVTSSILIQGKAVTIQTGTWHENATKGLGIYNQISDILGYRINVVNFTVGTEVLLGAGPLGTISVGSWVRMVSPAFSQGVADLFVVETASSELATQFRAYRFLGVGIQDLDDNNLPVGSPPISEADVPGDASAPDDEGLTDGETVTHRAYY